MPIRLTTFIRFTGLLLFAGAGFGASAATASLHLSQPQDDVQTSQGKSATNPISPGFSVGPQFTVTDQITFYPQLGYIRNEVKSKDHYSGKYKIETYLLLYDFLYPLNFSKTWSLRFGLATFIKKMKGSGGTVTEPNGTGTSTAYKPGKATTSYTSALNLGVDWKFSEGHSTGFFNAHSVGFEILTAQITNNEKRRMTYLLGLTAHF